MQLVQGYQDTGCIMFGIWQSTTNPHLRLMQVCTDICRKNHARETENFDSLGLRLCTANYNPVMNGPASSNAQDTLDDQRLAYFGFLYFLALVLTRGIGSDGFDNAMDLDEYIALMGDCRGYEG